MSLQPDVAGPQTEAAVSPPPTPQATPAVLHAAERALLRCVLNRIVPAHADLPGAGDLDVGGSIERTLAETPRLRRVFLDGLRAIAIVAERQTGSDFARLEPERQTQVLQLVEQASPAFFNALVEHTYRGYYTRAEVQRALGPQARPPQPLGHQLPAFDDALLAQQRQRPPFWRRTS